MCAVFDSPINTWSQLLRHFAVKDGVCAYVGDQEGLPIITVHAAMWIYLPIQIKSPSQCDSSSPFFAEDPTLWEKGNYFSYFGLSCLTGWATVSADPANLPVSTSNILEMASCLPSIYENFYNVAIFITLWPIYHRLSEWGTRNVVHSPFLVSGNKAYHQQHISRYYDTFQWELRWEAMRGQIDKQA